jgi:hypothetical protein
MTNDKKLVIKINYQNKDGGFPEVGTGKIEYLTEWRIKRIAGAIAALCLLIALGGYFRINRSADTHKNQTAPIPVFSADTLSGPVTQATGKMGEKAPAAIIDKEVEAKPKTPPRHSPANTGAEQKTGAHEDAALQTIDAARGIVARGILTKSIVNKEPSGVISLPLTLGKNGAQTLYYFTELQNMSGKEINHEWLYKGKSVFKRPIRITEQRWRTATHKTIRSNAPGDWSVRLTDGQGNILQQIDFKVVVENNG